MRLAAAVAALLLGAAPARAGLFGRSRVASRWTAKPLVVDADDTSWKESSAFEDEGLAVMAMNDGSDLYLLVTAHTREVRDQLLGESHQDLAVWFVGRDGKTRRWGARIPFSRRAAATASLRDPAGVDPEPELVQYQGAEISSATFPGDVVDRLASVGRRPVWELKVPLKRLEPNEDGAVAVDFVVNAPNGGPVRRAVAEEKPEEGRKRGKRANEAQDRSAELVWDAASWSLTVALAPDPAATPRR